MIDTAIGRATLDILPSGVLCASIEVHIRYMRAIIAGEVRVEVGVLRQGRRIVHLEAKTFNASGELTATAAGRSL